jgi:hypothetical protein
MCVLQQPNCVTAKSRTGNCKRQTAHACLPAVKEQSVPVSARAWTNADAVSLPDSLLTSIVIVVIIIIIIIIVVVVVITDEDDLEDLCRDY